METLEHFFGRKNKHKHILKESAQHQRYWKKENINRIFSRSSYNVVDLNQSSKEELQDIMSQIEKEQPYIQRLVSSVTDPGMMVGEGASRFRKDH